MTEFAIMLPVFLILFTALLHLAALGNANVKVNTHAYANMWEDANEKSNTQSVADDPGLFTPRSAAADVIDTNFTSAPDVVDGAVSAAETIGGHWGESRAYASMGTVLSAGSVNYTGGDLESAERLSETSTMPPEMTTDIIGSEHNRPTWAFNDNLATAGEVYDFEGDIDVDAVAGMALTALLGGSGAMPALFAGIRYGDGEGSASSTVSLESGLLGGEGFDASFQGEYGTALSPQVGDVNTFPGTGINEDATSFGREQQQWFFYYGTGQAISNQRNLLDLLGQDLDGSDNFEAPEPYGWEIEEDEDDDCVWDPVNPFC